MEQKWNKNGGNMLSLDATVPWKLREHSKRTSDGCTFTFFCIAVLFDVPLQLRCSIFDPLRIDKLKW